MRAPRWCASSGTRPRPHGKILFQVSFSVRFFFVRRTSRLEFPAARRAGAAPGGESVNLRLRHLLDILPQGLPAYQQQGDQTYERHSGQEEKRLRKADGRQNEGEHVEAQDAPHPHHRLAPPRPYASELRWVRQSSHRHALGPRSKRMAEDKHTDEQSSKVGRDALSYQPRCEQADGGDAVADQSQPPNAEPVGEERLGCPPTPPKILNTIAPRMAYKAPSWGL